MVKPRGAQTQSVSNNYQAANALIQNNASKRKEEMTQIPFFFKCAVTM